MWRDRHISTHLIKPLQRGFTLVELLVVLAILSLLAAILLPVLASAREQARKASCQSNLYQMGMAIMQYVQDHDENHPFDEVACTGGPDGYQGDPFTRPGGWVNGIMPYVKSQNIFQCPSASKRSATQSSLGLTYWLNGPLFCQPATPNRSVPIAAIRGVSHVVTAFDDLAGEGRDQMVYRLYWTGFNWTDNNDFTTFRNNPRPHNEMVNVLWADNHVKAIRKDTLMDIVMSMSVWP